MKKFLLSIFAVLFAFAGVQAEEVTFTAVNAGNVGTSGTGSEVVLDNGAVKVVLSKAFGNGTQFRIYSGCSLTVTGTNVTITGVEFTAYDGKTAAITLKSGGGNITSNGNVRSWAGSSNEIVLSASGQIRTQSIVVTYTTTGEGGGEETPVAPDAPTLPASCYFDDAMTVEITGIADGATAYYSLNDENNWIEGSSVDITETTTVYAKAVKDELSSDVVSATYTKLEEGTMMITFATNATDNNTAATTDNFVSDHIKEHNFETTLTCSATNKCYMGVSGLKMGSSSINGSFTLLLGGGYKVTSIIVRAVKYSSEAASVAVNGAASQALTTSLADYTFDFNSEISQIEVGMTKRGYIESIMIVCQEGAGSPEPVAPNAPVLPASTTFESSMSVEITGIAADATVYYTTDESDPATSDTRVEYTEPFEITATTTVKAVAVNEVGESVIAEATYTLVETITLGNCTVAELIEAYTSGNNIADDATVVGYIVGAADGSLSKAEFGTATVDTNILLADDPYETNVENCIPVQLPSGDVRTALNLKDNSDNYQKKVILTGDVQTYFNVAGLKNTSAYEFVEMFYNTITVSDAGWATLYLPTTARIPSNVEAYTVTAVNDGWVSLTQVTGVIPANTGIIVKANAGEYELIVSETATTDVTGNLLSGSAYPKNIEEEAYVLGKVDGVVGLYKAEMTDGVWHNNAFKAYLPASALTPAQQTAAFYGFDWDGTTGVEKVEIGNEKSEIYDLTGRRVEEITEPGIYIVGGRKVLVK